MQENVIKYRRERAKETLEEAEIMLENNKLIAAVNRMYYAIFYEVLALLLTKGLSSSKHSGVRSLFNKEFVKPGIILKNMVIFITGCLGSSNVGIMKILLNLIMKRSKVGLIVQKILLIRLNRLSVRP